MDTFTGIVYYVSSLGVLAFTITFFILGLRIAQKNEEKKWKEQCRQSIQRAVKTMQRDAG